MLYPITLHEFPGGLQLHVPDPDKVKPLYDQLIAINPQTAFPFWARIWPSSLALTSFLQKEPHWVSSKNVLEIGAGIGLPSFSNKPRCTFFGNQRPFIGSGGPDGKKHPKPGAQQCKGNVFGLE